MINSNNKLTDIDCTRVNVDHNYESESEIKKKQKFKNVNIDSCGNGDRIIGQSFFSRSPSVGKNGMVSSSHPLVSQTALKILKKGGSAVDAAIAANIIQGVVEPMHCGIGGDLMSIIYNPSDNKLYGYNGSGRSSKTFGYNKMVSAMKKHFKSSNIPRKTSYSITVPGALQSWCDMHEKFGILKWNELFEDAIEYANNGFIVTQIIAEYWYLKPHRRRKHIINEATLNGKYLHALDGLFDIYTNAENKPPKFGDLFQNPKLGEIYKIVSTEGCDAFYRGSLTDKIVSFLHSVGSPLQMEDFNNYSGEWVATVNVTYRDKYLVSQLPPNAQGIATLQMLNIMELYPFGRHNWNLHSINHLHTSIEIKKLVFADRAKYYGDTNCIDINKLISKSYAKQRNMLLNIHNASTTFYPSGNIDMSLCNHSYKYDINNNKLDDTIYLTTADKNGMMVSLIQSNGAGFGSGIVSSDLGFVFHNRGSSFSLIKNSLNQYDTMKRPFHSLIPSFIHVLNDNKWHPYMSFGVMGGLLQPQSHVQIISNIVDYNLNIQEAGDAARWMHGGSRQPNGLTVEDNGGIVKLESGICTNVAKNLTKKGHNVIYEPNNSGYQAILRNVKTGIYFGATEMRKDGVALGY